jgi:hypothetical protein
MNRRARRPSVPAAQIVVHHRELMDPRYPEPDEAAQRAAAEAVGLLLDEG